MKDWHKTHSLFPSSPVAPQSPPSASPLHSPHYEEELLTSLQTLQQDLLQQHHQGEVEKWLPNGFPLDEYLNLVEMIPNQILAKMQTIAEMDQKFAPFYSPTLPASIETYHLHTDAQTNALWNSSTPSASTFPTESWLPSPAAPGLSSTHPPPRGPTAQFEWLEKIDRAAHCKLYMCDRLYKLLNRKLRHLNNTFKFCSKFEELLYNPNLQTPVLKNLSYFNPPSLLETNKVVSNSSPFRTRRRSHLSHSRPLIRRNYKKIHEKVNTPLGRPSLSKNRKDSAFEISESQETTKGKKSGLIKGQVKTFCICQGPSYGRMIRCEASRCISANWFHFHCVGLNYKPSGKWICPDCQRVEHDNVKPREKEIDKKKLERNGIQKKIRQVTHQRHPQQALQTVPAPSASYPTSGPYSYYGEPDYGENLPIYHPIESIPFGQNHIPFALPQEYETHPPSHPLSHSPPPYDPSFSGSTLKTSEAYSNPMPSDLGEAPWYPSNPNLLVSSHEGLPIQEMEPYPN